MTSTQPWTNTQLPILGLATNDSSTCQACLCPIKAGSIRVGIIFQHLSGFIGLDWHHLTCCETPQLLRHVDGYELLGDDSKATLNDFIAISEQTQCA
ncbi:hypothetical protein H257_15540 [Aphanomyces astaci]|uniref:PARP-type domain-containing protein n=1 Tax=Aphanomyces astaci TaxID=112090 RepID=W4FP20_APHAT|nr:hypothetical protein H257_15540 [Aphanomyces astaci]ETV68554.1 hypothetical protein H257_15540 [Aphanomyces astaci]RHY17207.1 hypothetical protein DYB25_001925 [Aphanomyces astaci]RHY22117.1 hypothetical protein DYB36_004251 [Aphanomyces astaci]RHY45852.1 hypothetical protein DYB34_004145 [Aphanomyces astaci]RHY58584.1 hypothetical protein DYB38_003225 [Aphanomyces astaci]|eukprot:XP_009841983.1 hypothetical protein H257_15540 [Aphanomyces astaci]